MRHVAPSLVREYYLECVGRGLDDLALPGDASIAGYLSDVLARYAFRIDVHPESVAMHLAEIQRCWQIDGPAFDPQREVTLRREVADSALFLTGFLWERVATRRAQRHFIRMGRDAYRFLAEYHRAVGHPEAGVFGKLSRRFLRCSVLLMYVREVYLDVDPGRPVRMADRR